MKESKLVEFMNYYLCNNCIAHANEVRMGIGIPDIVVGSKMSESHNSIYDYYVLKFYCLIVENELTNYGEVERFTGLSRNVLKKYLQQLTDTGFIKLVNDSFEITKSIDMELIPTNISIEFKVKDWRSGLLQAQRYLQFSDYSYVALPEKNIRLVDRTMFESHGIGLISVSHDNIYEVLSPIKSSNCDLLLKYISISYIHQKGILPEGDMKSSNSLFSCLTN